MMLAHFALAAMLTVFATQDPPLVNEETGAYQFPEGHSHLSASFNEGPRQAAYLMDGLGEVDFPVTTSSDLARRFFHQGLIQLHGFWYLESERSFRQAAAIDPDCALAYWGMAMSAFEVEDRAAGFAREAFLRRDLVSPHEQMYLDSIARFFAADGEPTEDERAHLDGEAQAPIALHIGEPQKEEDRRKRFQEDFERIIADFPDDVEAKALLVNQRWLDRPFDVESDKDDSQRLLDDVFATDPLHPAHHYRIHLWDTRRTAARTLDSAAAIGHSAPAIAHMWHMGGHVYANLNRHADAAFQQEASARVDHTQMMRDHLMPDEIHNYAHNNEWLVRSLRNVGRVHDAIDLARNMIELPRHPKYNTLEKGNCSASYGRRRLFDTLMMFEQWNDLLRLADTMYLEPSEKARDEALRASLLGWAHFQRDEREALAGQIARLEALLSESRSEEAEAGEGAEAEGRERRRRRRRRSPSSEIKGRLETLRGLARYASGLKHSALERLEDSNTSKVELSLLYLEAGRFDEAVATAREAAKNVRGVALPLANLAYVLWRCAEMEQAAQVFEDRLRPLSARFDLDLPPLARLAGLAEALGYAEDWRVAVETPDDVGQRPDLAKLGPFRWAPVPAESWALPDGFGNSISLSEYHGRPVVVVFFLGFGCVHCVEQLQALGPAVDAFRQAGIEIVAIGTDGVEQLAESESEGRGSAYGFPLLADPELTVFRQWRCYDDFEDLVLHGTFLIDANGLVRWQDISYEPFMDVEFLLAESTRLLGLPAAGATVDSHADSDS